MIDPRNDAADRALSRKVLTDLKTWGWITLIWGAGVTVGHLIAFV